MFLPISFPAILLPTLLALEATASPLVKRAAYKPALEREFADPAVLLANDGKYYAYATWGNGKQVQVATSDDGLSWTYQDDVDALPTLPGWAWVQGDDDAGPETWAVDVAANDDGRYYMYFSTKTNTTVTPEGVHCLGVAVASDPVGPFDPLVEYWDEPWECDAEAGVIDPEQFTDRDGEKFVLYKVDGNHIGSESTPIMIQRVDADGRTKVGDAVEILNRDDADGILIEAPSLNLVGDTYYLTFSSNYWDSDLYDTSYATATSVLGPYTKAGAPDAPLLVTDESKGIFGPGGADITLVPNLQPAIMVYHAFPVSKGNADTDNRRRYMFAAQVELHDGKITIYNQPER